MAENEKKYETALEEKRKSNVFLEEQLSNVTTLLHQANNETNLLRKQIAQDLAESRVSEDESKSDRKAEITDLIAELRQLKSVFEIESTQ